MKDSNYQLNCITFLSTWDTFCLRFSAFLFGIWVFFIRFFKWAWNPSAFFTLNIRDNPPKCLTNPAFGNHSYVKLKSTKFHYVETGSKGQPLILLLHGFPDFWLGWRYQIPVLAEHFHVIALDLKGFGDSDKPLWRSYYQVEKILDEIKQFINAIGSTSCIVIGHDIGALLGWYFVHRYSDMVKKFVAVSCPHPNIYWDHLQPKCALNKWLKIIQLPYLPEIDALKEDINIINEFFSHLQLSKNKKNKWINPEEEKIIEAYKYTFSRTEDWTGPLNYYRNLQLVRITETAELLPMPVLLVTGNRDKLFQLEGIVKSSDFCDRFILKIIEDAGHFPHQENPDVFNKDLLNFLIHRENISKVTEKTPAQGIIGRMKGAVQYGNTVLLDVVQKTTNGVVQNAPRILFTTQNQL